MEGLKERIMVLENQNELINEELDSPSVMGMKNLLKKIVKENNERIERLRALL